MSELDLELKLRAERLLWSAGYYTRTNVKLASPARVRGRASPSVADLTDVDVLGIRFLEDLSATKVAVDCKAGKNVSPIGRAFWLRGVMEHLGVRRGYVVMARTVPEHQKEAAAGLGVSLLESEKLVVLQSRYPDLREHTRIGTREAHNYLEGNLSGVSEELSELLRYRDTTYWYLSPPRALTQAISIARRCRSAIDLSQKFHRALLLDVITLFGIALITLAGEVTKLAPSDLLEALRAYLFGGAEGITQRAQLIKQIRLLVDQLSGQQRLPIEEGAVQLDPPYLTTLAEALTRVMARPTDAAEAARYLKVRLIHGILYQDWDLPGIIGESYSPIRDKLATDLALTFLKASDFDLDSAKQLGFR